VEGLKKFVRFLDTISEWSGRIFGFLLLVICAFSVYEVITRRFLGKPTIWTNELTGYVFSATVLLLMGYTLLYRAHANVDLVYERFSPRTRAIVDIATYIVFVGLFVVVFFFNGIRFAGTSWAMLERSPSALNAPVYPAKTMIPLGGFLLLLQVVSNFIKRIVFLVKGVSL
jgi:TRAP-type mannitol/chloroaromatic compound transport system permease small subunit